MSFYLVQGNERYEIYSGTQAKKKSEVLADLLSFASDDDNGLEIEMELGMEFEIKQNIPSIAKYVEYINWNEAKQGTYKPSSKVDIFDEFRVGYGMLDSGTYLDIFTDRIRDNPDRERISELGRDYLHYLADNYVLPPSYLPPRYYPSVATSPLDIFLNAYLNKEDNSERKIDDYTRNWFLAAIDDPSVTDEETLLAGRHFNHKKARKIIHTPKYTYLLIADQLGDRKVSYELTRFLGQSVSGKRDGTMYEWRDNMIEEKTKYVDGVREGLRLIFNLQGEIDRLETYHLGYLHGPYYELKDGYSGKIYYTEKMWKDGRLVEQSTHLIPKKS